MTINVEELRNAPIAVLGGGAVGKTCAADCALAGQEVRICDLDPFFESTLGNVDKTGVTIMIEPLNTFVDHPGYYLTSSAEAFDMIREVDNPFVKVVYDMYHQQIMEGNIIPSVTKNLDLIAHLHAAGHPGRHELQNGELNYAVVFDALDKAGYAGACGLEYFPVLPSMESLETFKRLYL